MNCLRWSMAALALTMATLGPSVATAGEATGELDAFPEAHRFAPESCTVDAPLFAGATDGTPVMSPRAAGRGRFLEQLHLWVGISPDGTVYFAELEPGRKESLACAGIAQLSALTSALAVSLTAEEVASPMPAVRLLASVTQSMEETSTTLVLVRASEKTGGWIVMTADTVKEPIRSRCGDECPEGSDPPPDLATLTRGYRAMKNALAAKRFDTVEAYSNEVVRLPAAAMELASLWKMQGRRQRAIAALVLAGIGGRADAGVALGDLFWNAGRPGLAPGAYRFALEHWPAGHAIPARARLRAKSTP